jgi:hypothetical protein
VDWRRQSGASENEFASGGVECAHKERDKWFIDKLKSQKFAIHTRQHFARCFSFASCY